MSICFCAVSLAEYFALVPSNKSAWLCLLRLYGSKIHYNVMIQIQVTSCQISVCCTCVGAQFSCVTDTHMPCVRLPSNGDVAVAECFDAFAAKLQAKLHSTNVR